jgi:hypothetical protein
MPAANGNPEGAIAEECVEICDAVLFTVCIHWVDTFANANLMPLSIAVHLISIQPLCARNAKLATNNPRMTAAIFITFIASNCSKQESSTSRKKKTFGWQIKTHYVLSLSVQHKTRVRELWIILLVICILNDYTAVICGISIPKLDHAVIYLSVSFCGSCKT